MSEDEKAVFARNVADLLQSQSNGVGDLYKYWANELKVQIRRAFHAARFTARQLMVWPSPTKPANHIAKNCQR
jgi:hypothetical protein